MIAELEDALEMSARLIGTIANDGRVGGCVASACKVDRGVSKW